eukprot:Selendium_serpulae@DN4376_c0_g1_i1.p1
MKLRDNDGAKRSVSPGARSRKEVKRVKTDYDALRAHHKFLRSEEDEDGSWESKLARSYYSKLYKEYVIADFSRYRERKVGFRWRTETEVKCGKGQWICGGKRCNVAMSSSDKEPTLTSYEVLFNYVEHKQKKSALVKVSLCKSCSQKLSYCYGELRKSER